MHPLIINNDAKNAVKELVKFASHQENWYKVNESKFVPGDRLEYVIHLNAYRCVYTHTVYNYRHFRHLSISIPPEELYPNPIIAFNIAKLFGFTGGIYEDNEIIAAGKDWIMDINPEENCSVIAQEMKWD